MDTKFSLRQNPQNHLVKLELWRKYGEKSDEWLSDEKFTDMTIKELEQLLDFHTQMGNEGTASILKAKIEKLKKSA